jgi:hypothetical protein
MTNPDRATLTLMMTFAINWAQMLAEDAKTTREAERNVARFRKLQAKLIAQPDLRPLIAITKELIEAVESELEAAGPEEVRQHPMFQGKERTINRARKWLSRLG